VGELTRWTLVRHWGPTRRDHLRAFLDTMLTLPYDSMVAARWGEIQAYAQLRGRPRPVNDSWIAACCLVRDVPLSRSTPRTTSTSSTTRAFERSRDDRGAYAWLRQTWTAAHSYEPHDARPGIVHVRGSWALLAWTNASAAARPVRGLSHSSLIRSTPLGPAGQGIET
jgi:hypothetical protein